MFSKFQTNIVTNLYSVFSENENRNDQSKLPLMFHSYSMLSAGCFQHNGYKDMDQCSWVVERNDVYYFPLYMI